MAKRRAPAQARLDVFDNRYGHVVTNALMVYAEHQRREAAQMQAAYDKIKDDPEARAAQDATRVTCAGVEHAIRACLESADQADAARRSYEDDLTGEDD